MSSDEARRKIKVFAIERGGDLRLARHASLPVSLSPELLHLIRVNFLLDEPNPPPATAEFDLLISPLCREIGDGLYAMDAEVRNVLLAELTLLHGKERLRDIASLLWQYNRRYATWAERPGLERAQQLAALAFLDPHEAQIWLERTESELPGTTPVERQWFVAMRRELIGVVQAAQEVASVLVEQEGLSSVDILQRSKAEGQYRRNILVADDDTALQVVLEYALREHGYGVILVKNGQDALDILSQTHLDLVLADIHIAEMDGVEFFLRIKQQLQDDGIPIILMTHLNRKPWFADLEAEGAVILQKPFEVDRLIDMINITLDDEEASPEKTTTTSSSIKVALTQDDLIKIAQIRGYVTYQEILAVFPTPEVQTKAIDDLYKYFEVLGIKVTDDKAINPNFTTHERSVLELLYQSDAQIGGKLLITENEVKKRVGDIIIKLGARNRDEAISLAQVYKFIPSSTKIQESERKARKVVFAELLKKHAEYLLSLNAKTAKPASQRAIAQQLGIAERTWRSWLNGDRIPKPEKLNQIATKLKLTDKQRYEIHVAAGYTMPIYPVANDIDVYTNKTASLNISTLSNSLRSSLPENLVTTIPYLIEIIDFILLPSSTTDEKSEFLMTKMAENPILFDAINALAGKEVITGNSVISFETHSRVGEIEIRDIVGGNVIQFNLKTTFRSKNSQSSPFNPQVRLQKTNTIASPNPFVVRGRIDNLTEFLDRENLLQRVFTALEQGGSISLDGERGIGKTTLLSMICKYGPQRVTPSPNFIYLDLQLIRSEDDFITALCELMDVPKSRGYRLSRFLNGKRYIICLDEGEKMIEIPFSSELYGELRALSTQGVIQLVIATEERLVNLLSGRQSSIVSPLTNILMRMKVPPLTKTEVRQFILNKLEGSGISFTDQEVYEITEQSQGNPSKIQRLASIVYERHLTTEEVYIGTNTFADTYISVTFTGEFHDAILSGNFTACDFSMANFISVSLSGVFTDCDFTPEQGVIREKVIWSGEFANCRGVFDY